MRILAVFGAVMAIMFSNQVTWAQESAQKTDSPTPSTVFTPEQQEEAKAALKMLGQAFGVADEKPAQAATKTEQKKDKTVADVADKALDMAANAVTAIAGKMEQVAPKVWEVMVLQQYAKAIGDLIVPWGTIFLVLLAAGIARKYWKLTEAEASGKIFVNIDVGPSLTRRGERGLLTFLIPLIVITIFGFVGISRLSDSVMYVINPYYYAVKDLLQMLLNPGSL